MFSFNDLYEELSKLNESSFSTAEKLYTDELLGFLTEEDIDGLVSYFKDVISQDIDLDYYTDSQELLDDCINDFQDTGSISDFAEDEIYPKGYITQQTIENLRTAIDFYNNKGYRTDLVTERLIKAFVEKALSELK